MTTTSTMAIIRSYIDCVSEFTSALKQEFGVDNILAAKRKKAIPMDGATRDGRFKYCFHGIGCRAVCPEYTVDFDFGEGGAIGGFDAYRLTQFCASLGITPSQCPSEDEIQRDLESLCAQGVIVAPRREPSPHLLYIADDKPML